MTESEVIQNRADTIESEVTIDVRYQKFHEVTLDRESESRSVKGYFDFSGVPPGQGGFFTQQTRYAVYRVRCRKKKYARSFLCERQAHRSLNPARKRDRLE